MGQVQSLPHFLKTNRSEIKKENEHMETIDKTIEVSAPINRVYNQWTQFEEFPKFMEGVEQVKQVDDRHLHWVASIGGATREWDAEILEQVPDQRIAWRSTSGALNSGVVSFQALGPDRTRIDLKPSYRPEGAADKVGATLCVVSSRVEGDLKRFKEFIQNRGGETGAWRGKI